MFQYDRSKITILFESSMQFLKPTKGHFWTPWTQIVAALTAIGKGAKTKTVNVGNRGGKLKMEVNNGSLSISQTFPADIKRFAQKNNIGGYFIPEDCHFSLPSSELNHLLETFWILYLL